MKFTIIEEDLDKAIKERVTVVCSLSCSCLITQTFIREFRNNKIPFKKISTCSLSLRRGIYLTLNGRYTDYNGNAFSVLCSELESLMNKFDCQNYAGIRQQLPFTFEFEFPNGVENIERAN